MTNFSISQLEQFSGIKAHTIRIWEQRYNALNPMRSEGNTRHYDSQQLRRLLNIVSLSNAGYKISKLCKMPDAMLYNLLEDKLDLHTKQEGKNSFFISQLVAASADYDEEHFHNVYSDCVDELGLRDTYVQVLYPLLNRVGLMWITENISTAHEHFCSNLIKQKMYAAIEALPKPKTKKNSWVLFLPENEFHEIGLLFANFLLRQAGNDVIYLGNNLPLETLKNAVEQSKAKNLLFFLVSNKSQELTNEYVKNVKTQFKNQNIYVSGNVVSQTELANIKGINWVSTVEDFEKIV